MTRGSRLSALRKALVGRVPPRARQLINVARGIDQPLVVDVLPGERVVVVAPHPDDEVIGCGGALLCHRERGARIDVVLATSGERTWSGDADGGAAREREARAAAATLGLADGALHFLRLPDGKLDAAEDLTPRLTALLRELDPDLVYAPWPLDAHADHRALTRAIAAALAPRSRVALYEVWGPLVPTHIVDVTAHIDRKVAALVCYESATAGIDYGRTARGLAAYRSGQGLGGRGYGEAFCVVTVADLAALMTAD